MAERKSSQVIFVIEPSIFEMVDELIHNQGSGTISSYMRNLVIKDMFTRGKLSAELMYEMLVKVD